MAKQTPLYSDLQPFPDTAGQRHRFEQAVHSVVGGPDFDKADFVRKLVAFRLAQQSDWRRRVDRIIHRHTKRNEQFDRLADRLSEKINSAAAEKDKEHARHRLAKRSAVYICDAGDGRDDPLAGAEATSFASYSAHRVLGLLDQELLAAPDALQVMLEDSDACQDALAALARIGPPGAPSPGR